MPGVQARLEDDADDEEVGQQQEALINRHQGHVVRCEGLVRRASCCCLSLMRVLTPAGCAAAPAGQRPGLLALPADTAVTLCPAPQGDAVAAQVEPEQLDDLRDNLQSYLADPQETMDQAERWCLHLRPALRSWQAGNQGRR